MSSKKTRKPASTAPRKANDEGQSTNILQAVVLTDSYQTRFRPLTLETPRCLLPLANVPLIEYTLEFLSLAGVEDVFIFASTHAEKIETYIRDSKWNQPSSPFRKCQIIMSPASMSVGDAMRELDSKSMISSDFLLVNGDFVSNLPLEGVLAEHRKRRTADKNAIMTMVLKEAGFSHRTKARGETGVFVIDEATNKCVHYEELLPSSGSKIFLPPDLTKSHTQLRVRTDLIDCHLDICSPDVPALFTENFDYQRIRRDFLHGILTDFELYGKTIHTHIISEHYAARVRSLQTYDAVSRDIVSRWTYPLCPDSNFAVNQAYSRMTGNVFKEDLEECLTISKSAIPKRNTVLGRGTSVGNNTIITDSIVGPQVKIGENCAVDGAYIWSGVQIGDGCKIRSAIIADNAVIGKNCIILPGSIISYGVKVPDGSTVEGTSRLSRFNKINREETAESASGSDYETSDSEDEDEQASAAHDRLISPYLHPGLAGSDSSISTLPGEDSDYESDLSSPRLRPRSTSITSAGSDVEDESWHKEAVKGLLVAMEADHPTEVASLELNSMRMTQNASWHQVRRALCASLTMRIEQIVTNDSKTIAQATASVISRWVALIKRCIHEREDQVDFLLLWQRECCTRAAGESLMLNACKAGYELEFIEEEAVDSWWEDAKSSGDEKMAKIRKGAEVFVKWLAEAEEEGSDDEDEESEDEESEEEEE